MQTGHTQQELADELGYTRTYVAQILNGHSASRQAMEAIDAQLLHWRAVARDEKRRRHAKR